jgi:hypothetical protein
MMNFIKQTPPTYRGCPQQPKPSGGLFAQLLCYVFGGGTPSYKGSGQPVSTGCGVPGFPGAPSYATPDKLTTDPTEEPELDDSDGDDVDGRDPSELNGSRAASTPMQTTGPITIVVG